MNYKEIINYKGKIIKAAALQILIKKNSPTYQAPKSIF